MLQLRASRFHPLLYWTVIVSTSTAGTTMSDYMDRTLGLGYATGSLILVSGLAVVLAAWRWSERSALGGRDPDDPRRDVLLDRDPVLEHARHRARRLSGRRLGPRLRGGALLIGASIALIALAYRFTRIDRVLLFWIAFVLTRPFGATFGDLLTKPARRAGSISAPSAALRSWPRSWWR